MTLEEIHKATFKEIYVALKGQLSQANLKKIFGLKSWHPYPNHVSYPATKKRMEALVKLFRIFATWGYQKGYEDAINELKQK